MLKPLLVALLAIYAAYKIRTSVVTSRIDEEYDFIIVGGGTTGAAVAGRLSEDPNYKILLLEAGPSDMTVPMIRVPGYEPLVQTSADWNYRTVPQEHGARALPSRVDRWPAGKILGGTSSFNHLIYHRGSPHDYDSWRDHGAVGWSWEEVKPFFKKVERAVDRSLSKSLGRNGPLYLERGYKRQILNDIVEEATKEIGMQKTDYIDEPEGFSELVVARHDGMRINSVETYLRKHFPKRRNRLHVVVSARVTKILFKPGVSNEKPKASGVTFVKNGVQKTVTARKEVILSAGVVETPHLLMLSGIGPRDHLQEHDIPVLVNLPGVGSNLQEHLRMIHFLYSNKLPKSAVSTMAERESPSTAAEYIANATGPLLTSFLTAFIHYRTNLAGTPQSQSTSQRPFPEIQLGLLPLKLNIEEFRNSNIASTAEASSWVQEVRLAMSERGGVLSSFGIVAGLLHPKSTGTIRLNSSDPFQDPLIDPKYLSNEDDVDVFTAGLKVVEEMLQTDSFRKLGLEVVMQPFCNTSENNNFPRSDEFYRCWLKSSAVAEYHPCCSAKIGAISDENAVVDERLRVYGVEGLRIADISVMPHQISGNTMGPCYMIAEKAAHMIKEDYGKTMKRRKGAGIN